MQRILIIGCSGGGKSTLARSLGAKLGISVTHLDALWWKPGWVESAIEEFRPRVAAVVAGESWIVDGNFSRTFDIRMPRADTIVWVDQPRLVCLWRAFWRAATQFGRVRADLAPGCPEKFDPEFFRYIWNFRKENEAEIEAALATFGRQARLVRLRSDAEIAAFLSSPAG
ncbi:MAG: topology modulation protein [Parvibaculum sp.]|uniref:topology modulation protein n=1 Tax=Parvibaculum sp. TaxID=2024848 RepID=UPI0028470242|nr:topology modulation protein [Parvibaculum sp.]MDR3498358.1 topology modulation protein [Parvibaculum sp.]